jgi:hypothetical protein
VKINQLFVVTVLATACLAVRAGAPTAGELIDLDAQVAKTNMQAQLAKAQANAGTAATGGAGQGIPTTPVTAAGTTADSPKVLPPATTAVYGLDASQIGIKPSLRSLVRWGQVVYPAYKGATIRGFKVTNITIEGTTLAKGAEHIFAATEIDDGNAVESPGRPLDHKVPNAIVPLAATSQATPATFLSTPTGTAQ